MSKNVFFKIILILTIFIVLGIILYVVIDDASVDEKKFKTEYEQLNGQKNDNNKVYPAVKISKNNNIKYASFDDVMDVLDSTGIIYFGFPECPWCRNAVPILIRSVLDNDVDTLYYFNALSIRDEKVLKDGKIVTSKKGTSEYYKLIDKLGNNLTTYKGLDDESIKRLYFPTVVFVRNGKVVGTVIGTVSSQKDPYKTLNEKQANELEKIYSNNIKKVYGVCDDKC